MCNYYLLKNNQNNFDDSCYSNDNLFVDHFEKTGLIRPDSIGLFMSNFKSNPIQTDDSVELTVWSPDSTDSIEMIKDVVPKTLNFMKSYLATNFPTNKLDIVIVPSTVMTSAESPGLIVIKFVDLIRNT